LFAKEIEPVIGFKTDNRISGYRLTFLHLCNISMVTEFPSPSFELVTYYRELSELS